MRAACCMLWVTMTMVNSFFNSRINSSILRGGDGVQRGGRFVHQDDLRLDGDGAGDAQALLLAAGQAQRAGVQPVLHLVPQRRLPQAVLDDCIQFGLGFHALQAQAVGDVFVDGFGKRIGFLEHHADALAQFDHIHVRGCRCRGRRS